MSHLKASGLFESWHFLRPCSALSPAPTPWALPLAGQAYGPGPNPVANGRTCNLDLHVPDLPPGWESLSPGILSGQGGILALPSSPARETRPPQAQATGDRQDTEARGTVGLQKQDGSVVSHDLRMFSPSRN